MRERALERHARERADANDRERADGPTLGSRADQRSGFDGIIAQIPLSIAVAAIGVLAVQVIMAIELKERLCHGPSVVEELCRAPLCPPMTPTVGAVAPP